MDIIGGKLLSVAVSDIKDNTITIPEGVKVIDPYAFFFLRTAGIEGLKKLVLPGSLESVDSFSVKGLPYLEEVVLSEGIKEVKRGAFADGVIKKVQFPSTLEVIGNDAFSNNDLQELVFPDNLSVIGEMAFDRNRNLKTLNLPKALSQLNEMAFYNCKSLSEVNFYEDSPITHLQSGVFSGTALKKLVLPNNIKSVLHDSISEMANLSVLKLNNGVKQVNIKNTSLPNLTEITLPATVVFGEFLLQNDYKVNFMLPNGKSHSVNLAGKDELKTYSNYEGIRVVSADNQHYVLQSNSVTKIDQEELGKISGSMAIVDDKKIDHYYLWMKRLKEIYGGEVKNYPTKEEILQIPLNKVENFVKNRKLFNEINNKIGQYLTDYGSATKFMRFALSLGLLDTNPGVKNKVITFIRENFYDKKTLQIFSRLALLEKKEDCEFNAKKFEMVENIFKEKNNTESNLRAIMLGLNHFDDIIKLKRTITSENVKEYVAITRYGNVSPENLDLARLASVFSLDQDQFNRISNLINFNRQTKVRGLLTYLQKETKDTAIKQQMVSDNIMEEVNSKYRFEWLKKDDPYNAMLGYICNCCATIDGAGNGVLRSSIAPNEPVQNLVVKNENGSIIGKSTVFLDIEQGQLMFNNVELNWDFNKKTGFEEKLQVLSAFKRGVDAMISEYNKVVEGTTSPEIKKAYIGMVHNDLEAEIKEVFKQVPEDEMYLFANYGGYSTDSISQYDFYPEGKER